MTNGPGDAALETYHVFGLVAAERVLFAARLQLARLQAS
jgi:hypothetical protein